MADPNTPERIDLKTAVTTAPQVTVEQLHAWGKACDDLRLDAYYYCFNGTGDRAIDLILSAVATAGKGAHHTEDWCEAGSYAPYYGADTLVDLIQRAADWAAADVRRLRAEVEQLTAQRHAALAAVADLEQDAGGWAPEPEAAMYAHATAIREALGVTDD